ncbi:hypothetical protein TTHERM_000625949 (macronuclear) [Tetrahymena thermophila SB210]|uniref:Transmembrane protein n=1 Tax=Tetrahymena thermophila (strain SB210) TaxID=312017 RepID=W7XAU5_TETTS|nr:hypothetical protein TTHERM_000625949 [Tetrahymena thermophila SB210]EWS73543.1 hypothetical protein TTHERM_000625949 [Tetrahymena thermophila SB210]|eukprot:XP_012653933.1 hypothetical protein TTHERM_000625949 [Tetrahymena thermophila SB210]
MNQTFIIQIFKQYILLYLKALLLPRYNYFFNKLSNLICFIYLQAFQYFANTLNFLRVTIGGRYLLSGQKPVESSSQYNQNASFHKNISSTIMKLQSSEIFFIMFAALHQKPACQMILSCYLSYSFSSYYQKLKSSISNSMVKLQFILFFLLFAKTNLGKYIFLTRLFNQYALSFYRILVKPVDSKHIQKRNTD